MSEQSELVQALSPVIRFFEDYHIRYFVGGSVASSHHGASRSTLDVDRLGNEISERQWGDLTTVVRLNRSELDIAYLQYWAKQLEVEDLLLRLLSS